MTGERPLPWSWLALALLVLRADPAPARPDLVFKVPEVTVRHAAVPRPVGTGPANGTRGPGGPGGPGGPDGPGGPGADSPPADLGSDYYIEHEVSINDAKKAAQVLKLSQLPEMFGCGQCTRWEMEYCSSSVLADHCCCERRYVPEPFPWLPHACYMGRARCEPLAGNCARYTRLRDCCCTRTMAEKWKGILSSARRLTLSGALLLLTALTLVSLYL